MLYLTNKLTIWKNLSFWNFFLILFFLQLHTVGFSQEVTVDTGFVRSIGINGNLNSSLGGFADNFGEVLVADSEGNANGAMFVNSIFNHGELRMFSDDQQTFNVWLTATGANTDNGWLGLYDASNEKRASMGVNLAQAGFMELFGANGNRNVNLTSLGSNHGYIGCYDELGTSAHVIMAVNPNDGAGVVQTWGPNGSGNIFAGTGDLPDLGKVTVSDTFGAAKAGMEVDINGMGVLFADIKNFKTQHPAFPEKEIWYASLEGPEAGAYVRGTSKLVQGRSIITLPDHFMHIAAKKGVTIILTPLSINSKGLAVTKKDMTGGLIEVGEMFEGEGTYEFDWEIKGVRKGFENYQTVREKRQVKSSARVLPARPPISPEPSTMGSPSNHR